MYHVECIDVRKGHPMFEYCDSITAWSKNMYNVANYHIRNVMTGLKKSPEERTANEEEVLKTVFDALKAVNSKRVSKGKKPFELPTPEKWFLNYYALNAVFKEINNIDYRSGPVHTMQNSIRDCCEAWNGYFSALKAYQSNPEQFTGKPKIPGYVKSPHRVAVISNQESTVKLDSLSFPKATRRFNVSALPHASTDKLIEIRINPYFDLYQIQIVTDDGIPEQSLEDITVKDGACMIDFGLENFAAIVDNKGNAPIVIKGGAIKSVNQFYNKETAKLRSILMKGHDPKTYRFPTTKRMNGISRKRDAKLRDLFYKIAHRICRICEERGLRLIICGKNPDQKRGIELGHKNNQEFVQIPFERFFQILRTVAVKYKLRVVEQEESYTSKASFLDQDYIPVYGTEEADTAVFSGCRTKRGMYRAKDQTVLNADVNAAANIGRKYDPEAFSSLSDFGFLSRTVERLSVRSLNPIVRKVTAVKSGRGPVSGQSAC